MCWLHPGALSCLVGLIAHQRFDADPGASSSWSWPALARGVDVAVMHDSFLGVTIKMINAVREEKLVRRTVRTHITHRSYAHYVAAPLISSDFVGLIIVLVGRSIVDRHYGT
jgi:hypothetical protein